MSRFTAIRALLLSALILLSGAGCGVAFHESFTGTELFKRLIICDAAEAVCTSGSTREFPAGAALKVDLVVTQGYPVPVDVACYYADESHLTDDDKKVVFQERATLAAHAVLAPTVDRRPDQKHQPEQHLIFDFAIPRAGDYFLACLTPVAGENGLGASLKIR